MTRVPPSDGVCTRDLVKSRDSWELRISPLTASAVTRATTSPHTSPPFIVVRLVRDLMSVRVYAAIFCAASNTQFLQYLTKTASVWPRTDVVHTDWTNCELNLWMQLCISIHVRIFVNTSTPLSTPATFLKFRSPFAAFSTTGPQWRELRSHPPIPLHSCVCHNSLCFAPHFDEMRCCNCVSSCCTAACSSATCPICV